MNGPTATLLAAATVLATGCQVTTFDDLTSVSAAGQPLEKRLGVVVKANAVDSAVPKLEALLANSGSGKVWVRIEVPWPEYMPDNWWTTDWDRVDELGRAITELHDAGAEIYLTVFNTPAWAQKYSGSECGPMREEDRTHYVAFFMRLIGWLKPAGVMHYEFWNEPDGLVKYPPAYMGFGCWASTDGAGARAYAEVYEDLIAAKKANGHDDVRIWFGGLAVGCGTEGDGSCQPGTGLDFLNVALDHLSDPGIVDGVSFHAYESFLPEWQAQGVANTLAPNRLNINARAVRDVMAAHGVGAAPIFMSEGGYLFREDWYVDGKGEPLGYPYTTELFEEYKYQFVGAFARACDAGSGEYELFGCTYYTLEGARPEQMGWHRTGLTYRGSDQSRPGFVALKEYFAGYLTGTGAIRGAAGFVYQGRLYQMFARGSHLYSRTVPLHTSGPLAGYVNWGAASGWSRHVVDELFNIGSGSIETLTFYVQPDGSLMQAGFRGGRGYWRWKPPGQWLTKGGWLGGKTPGELGLLGSGTVQSQTEYFYSGGVLAQGNWRNNLGYYRECPPDGSGGTDWGACSAWYGPMTVDEVSMPGGGAIDAQYELVLPDIGEHGALQQEQWRGGSGYRRFVPLRSNGQPDWSRAGSWGAALSR